MTYDKMAYHCRCKPGAATQICRQYLIPISSPPHPHPIPGAWICYDEFNRLLPEVLSVCSTQYKTVLDGIRAGNPRFIFDEEDIPIFPTAMAFITMNPGYAGRQDLPENLKVLFRPVAMVVPDYALIGEICFLREEFTSCHTDMICIFIFLSGFDTIRVFPL